ncbi:hypothetical protein ASPSYDRAFT_1179252 [Aspergillus sydowii CBS 593.65]|uniref:Uncharacterized protein n=1 Tax=Aspergillus sydowii CBS 593.65 TaxID=1036612 RepID=A0A1L9TCY9_9EURO|nr:uncharacterized protein ASPSYDRAFT_1179252 [Aspergillus sydowii CBS 593.65]OJJ57271.1 hypothetical protein ASPSYDRAFT_1179252 [Aspergillus sydowii CBS 593.65]
MSMHGRMSIWIICLLACSTMVSKHSPYSSVYPSGQEGSVKKPGWFSWLFRPSAAWLLRPEKKGFDPSGHDWPDSMLSGSPDHGGNL